MISNTIFLGVNFGLQIVISRLLSVQDYGHYSFIISLVSISTMVLTTGIPLGASKLVSKQDVDRNLVISLAKVSFFFMIISLFLYLVFGILLAPALETSALVLPALAGIAIIPTYGYSALLAGILNGKKEYLKQAAQHAIQSVSKFILSIVFLFYGWGIMAPIVGQSFAGLITFLIAGIWVVKIGFGEISNQISVRSITNICFPVTVFFVLFELITRMGLIFLEAYFPANDIAGLYASTLLISTMIIFMLSSVTPAVFPVISSIELDRISEDSNFKRSLELMLIITVPLVAILMITPIDVLVTIFGNRYENGSESLVILGFAMALFAFGKHIASLSFAINEVNIINIVSVITMVVEGVALVILVPTMGLTGAAIGTLVASIIFTLPLFWLGNNKFGFPSREKMGKTVFIGLVSATLLAIPTSGFIEFAVKLVLFLGVYCILAFMSGLMSIKELRGLLSK
jgi:stage V sporulation protein B